MNIQTALKDLAEHGWTQDQIAKEVGVSQPAISKVLLGQRKDMLHQNAVRLIALHKRVCGRKVAA